MCRQIWNSKQHVIKAQIWLNTKDYLIGTIAKMWHDRATKSMPNAGQELWPNLLVPNVGTQTVQNVFVLSLTPTVRLGCVADVNTVTRPEFNIGASLT